MIKGFDSFNQVLIHPDFSNSNSCKGLLGRSNLIHSNSFESKSGQMEEAGTNGRSPVDKWKCQGQMDKSNHSKPTRVVGRGRDNFDSIVPVLIQFFMFCYFDSFYSKAVLIQYWYFDSLISIMIQFLQF
ncbi:hypothetical protein LXL04_014995 [Taraxacum kok-saghyz]